MVRIAIAACLLFTAALAPAQEPAPKDLDFGPYVPYYDSKVKLKFKSRAQSICGRLAGLNKPCKTCKAQGLVRVVIREGYYDDAGVWIPPVEDVRDCPTCRRRKSIYSESIARSFVRNGLSPESRSSSLTERALLSRLAECMGSYRRLPRLNFEVHGRFATVTSSASEPIFPLHFFLVPVGEKFEWYLHDPQKHGEFNPSTEFANVPARADVTDVYAGDILRITGRRVVRLAGITVPGPDGKVLDGPIRTPDETLRDLVMKELKGKSVKLSQDRRAPFSCRGVPVVFVDVADGETEKDFAEELIRRGLVRRHPKHKSKRSSAYLKAEKEAREQKAGVWAKILDED